jgi:hypothetical protein
MTGLARFLVALLLLPLAAACGGDDYEPPPGGPPVIVDRDDQRRKREAKEKQAAGKLLQEGDGYWYVRPKDWRDRTRPYQDIIPFLDNAITEKGEQALYAELMYVTVLPGGPYLKEPLEDQTADFGRYLRGLATGVKNHKLTTIDRKQAVHHSGLSRGGAIEAQLDQYVVLSGDHLYTITFKLAVEHPKKERERLVQRILDTWHWDS